MLLVTSFRPRGSYGFRLRPFTLSNYVDLIQQKEVIELISNTLVYVSGTIVIGVAAGRILGLDHGTH